MDELEEASGQSFDWEHYLAVARRRTWHFLIPLFIGWSVVWGISWVLKPVYRSSTLILVEQPAVPPQYVVPNIASNLQDRLESITQQILSRTRLLNIINTRHLYTRERRYMGPDDLVDRMRKDITIELERSSGEDKLSSFKVSYSSHDPHVAQGVTSELTSLFISENVQARQEQSENTTRFLESRLQEARTGLAQQEDEIRRYKDRHLGELPGQLQSNLQILNGLQNQLQSEEEALNRAKQQSVYLQSLLQQYRDRERSVNQENQRVKGEQGLTGAAALNAELDRLRKLLAELSSRYTDRYPDVQKVKEQILRLEKIKQQTATSLAASKASGTSTSNSAGDTTGGGSSGGISAALDLESQLKANGIEIADRQHEIQALQGNIADYQSRLNQAPIREQQLADLTRGYDQSRANYDSLLKKKNDSELATSLELQQKSEHFLVLDPPSLPVKPYFPNRLKLSGIGVAVGILLGVGVGGGAEFLDDRIYREEEIRKLCPTIIAEIPQIVSMDDARKQRFYAWLQWTGASIITVTILAGCALSYYRG